MPLAVFTMLVFGICSWLSAGFVEALMRDFAAETEVSAWVFISVPGLLAMLFSLFLYRAAADKIDGVRESLSRALLVGICTWAAVSTFVSSLWCPGYRALSCARDVALVTGIIGGGPLLVAMLIAGTVVGIVIKRRVTWLSHPSHGPPTPKARKAAKRPRLDDAE